ncbi:MAG: cellulase family glycosylhydrolase [Chloroflexi bacterium]|nr:cellulase family glycosylhydrolase [Chloroflexota bacterium]
MRFLRYLPAIFVVLLVSASSLILSSDARASGSFVQVDGSHLVLDGQPVRVKGTDYYPSNNPWAYMWNRWDGPAIDTELAAAQSLGINSVRILVPYHSNSGWTYADGTVNPVYLDRLKEFLQIAGRHKLKVIVTLFDWYSSFDPPGSEEDRNSTKYLDAIVGALKNDDRVLAWDLHNEPDNYSIWQGGEQDKVIDWLARMAAKIRQIDTNHPITVGVGKADALWRPGPNGVTILDLVDIVSFHSYDITTIDKDIANIKAHTVKPVLLEETGWPTGPACYTLPDYTEARQMALFQGMIEATTKGDLAGIMEWTLFDFKPYRSFDWESESDYYGLIRLDGSLKPAADVFSNEYKVPPLPSRTITYTPLTIAAVSPSDPFSQIENGMIYFPETGHDLKTGMRDFWLLEGGESVFGKPLSEQLLEGDKVVQYFEKVRIERDKDLNLKQYEGWPKKKMLEAVFRVSPIGSELEDGKFAPLPVAPTDSSVLFFKTTGHSIEGAFLRYWEANGGEQIFGKPISEEVTEVSPTDGVSRTVQYFENARLEYHPEKQGTPDEIQTGPLGREYLQAKHSCAGP